MDKANGHASKINADVGKQNGHDGYTMNGLGGSGKIKLNGHACGKAPVNGHACGKVPVNGHACGKVPVNGHEDDDGHSKTNGHHGHDSLNGDALTSELNNCKNMNGVSPKIPKKDTVKV